VAGRPNLCGTPPNLYDNVHDGDGDGDGHIDGHALIAHMRALRTDPDWRVQLIAGPALWDIALIHWPTHTRLALRLAPVAGSGGALWHWVA